MDLRFTCLFLVAGLFLSSSAETEEGNKCEELTKPLTIEPSKVQGSWNIITGFTGHHFFNNTLEVTNTSPMNISLADTDSHLIIEHANRINGTCVGSKANIAVNDTIATIEAANTTYTLQLLPSCDGCLTFYMESTFRNIKRLLKVLKVNNHTTETVTVNAIYVMSNGTTIEESDHEHLRKQAKCLKMEKFQFIFKPEEEICEKDDVVRFLED